MQLPFNKEGVCVSLIQASLNHRALMEKIVSIMLACLLVSTCLPIQAYANSTDEPATTNETISETIDEPTTTNEVVSESTDEPIDEITEEPTEPTNEASTPLKRADLLNGSYIKIDTPSKNNQFLTTDRNATATVTLHEAVPSATLSVIAWPKTLSFGSDYVDSDDINRFGKRLFTKYNVKNGDVVDVTFNESVFSAIEHPESYVIIAYLQFSDTTSADAWPIVKPASSIEIVNEAGETVAPYEFPDVTIVEESLPVGATALHLDLTGDDRLFEIAKKSRGSSSALQIHITVVEYDANITPSDYDFEETEQTRLYSEDVYEPFTNKEITFSTPLTEGKRVRALVYTTQYLGDLAPSPIPASHDYTADKPDDSVLVSKDAKPIVLTPAISTNDALTPSSQTITYALSHVPTDSNSMLMVKLYSENEETTTQGGKFIASVPAADGTHTVTIPSTVTLNPGDYAVAFLMQAGSVMAQSAPLVVTSETTQSDIVIEGPIAKTSSTVTVNINCDIPAGAHLSLRQFNEPKNTEWGSQNAIGSIQDPVRGENTVSISGLRRDYVVAFLATDYGSTIYAASEPIAVTHEAKAPTVSLSPADVAFTEGDLYTNLTWSADEYAKNVTYTLYQFMGDELDVEQAEVIASGSISNYSSHSGTLGVSVSKPLKAGYKVQAVLSADDLSATSNVLEVGARPAWSLKTPQVSFRQDSIQVSDKTVQIMADYDEGYAELGSEYFCVVSVYQIDAALAENGYTDEDLEDTPISSVFYNDTRKDQTCGELSLNINESAQLKEGNYLVIKLRLPDAIRQDSQSMWRDYISEAIPIVADNKDSEDHDPLIIDIAGALTTASTTIPVSLQGNVPEGALLLAKSFTADEPIAFDKGTPLGIKTNLSTPSSFEFTPTKALEKDTTAVLFVLVNGEVIAQSKPITIEDGTAEEPSSDPRFTVTCHDKITPESTKITFTIKAENPAFADRLINVARIVPVREDGTPSSDYQDALASQFLVTPGEITFDVSNAHLVAGQKLCLCLMTFNPDSTFYSDALTVEVQADPQKVLLYNLGSDTERGAHIRAILDELGITAETITASDLDQQVGYLAGLSGFAQNDDGNTNPENAPSSEFMLMCGFDEALLDAFLDAMQEQAIRIDHKAIVTQYNRYYTLRQLIGDIANEHEVFQALLALDKSVKAAENLDEETYGAHEQWDNLQAAIAQGNDVLATEEPTLESLINAKKALDELIEIITNDNPSTDEENKPDPSLPDDDPNKPSEDNPSMEKPSEKPSGDNTSTETPSDNPSIETPQPLQPGQNSSTTGSTAGNSRPTTSTTNSATNSTINSVNRLGVDTAVAAQRSNQSGLENGLGNEENAQASDEASLLSAEAENTLIEGASVQQSIDNEETPLTNKDQSGQANINWLPLVIVCALVLSAVIVWMRKRKNSDR